MLSFALPSGLRLNATSWIVLIFVVLAATIPVTVFLLSQRFKASSFADNLDQNQGPVTKLKDVAKTPPAGELITNDLSAGNNQEESNSLGAKLTFGATLNFKIKLEGRPATDNSAKIFLGIAPGAVKTNPNYTLTFSVDVPSSGEYKGVSLAGLTQNSPYTAYLKGPSQIATSSAFVFNGNVVSLNPSGDPLLLVTGDLNEDNLIDPLDLGIAQKALGTIPSSYNWNAAGDFNLDKVVNNFDIAIITRNLGKAGASGIWYSRPPASPSAQVASGSAMLNTDPYTPQEAQGGYWFWMPKF